MLAEILSDIVERWNWYPSVSGVKGLLLQRKINLDKCSAVLRRMCATRTPSEGACEWMQLDASMKWMYEDVPIFFFSL